MASLETAARVFTDADSRTCRADFPALTRQHAGRQIAYLDGPAGTQVPRQVIEAMVAYYETANANTHGHFPTSEACDTLLLEARRAAAAFLGAPSWREVSFGANMTTLNFALARALGRDMEPGDEIVITALDHEANRGPWLGLREQGVVIREAALRPDGRLDGADLERQITQRTRLVALGLASNALGTVNDVSAARRRSSEVGADLLLDAVHYAAHLPLDVVALEADFLLCSPYKFYGPHLGLLYARPGLLDELETDRLTPQEQSAPYRIETGTLPHAAIVGTAAAIEYIASWGEGNDLRARVVSAMQGIAAYEHEVARRYWEEVQQIPGVTAWGPDFSSHERAPTVSISLDGVDPTTAAARLGERGIQIWHGDFYAPRAVEVLGLAERGGLLRTGLAMYNHRGEIDRLLEGLAEIAAGR